MSAERSRPPLHLRPCRSRRLALFVAVAHLLAAAALIPLALGAGWRAALLLLVGLSLAYHVWASLLARAPWSLHAACWSEQGWSLAFGNGEQRAATLLPSTLITPWLVVLNFRVHRLRYHSLLLTDEVLDPTLLRRLRVRLRLQRASP